LNTTDASRDPTPKATELVVLITGVVLLLVLIYLVIPTLSPFAIAAALIFLLYPLRQNPQARRLIWLSILVLIFWFFETATSVLAPFIIAFLLAYILNPGVTVLERRNFPRWASSLLLMILFVGLVVVALILIAPIVVVQLRDIIGGVSAIAGDAVQLTRSGKLYDLLAQYGVPREHVQEFFEKQIPTRLDVILKSLLEGALGFLLGVSSFITSLLNVIIIPFLTFYLLKDFPRILHWVESVLPEARQESIVRYFSRIDGVLGQYFRGAILVAIIQGLISGIVLALLGVRSALVLGILTAILDFIPYVGLLISLVVSSVAAMLSGEPTTMKVVGVVIMYLTQKLFENTVLAPKIIGSKVGVHPVLLILSLFVFGYLFGFVGLLIAVPLMAIIVQSIKLWEENRSQVASQLRAAE
jgi:predicted PurR-regulated permease PerM